MAGAELVLGLDDSLGAAAALRWATAFARRSGLLLAAIRVSPFLADPPSDWSAERAPPERRSDYELGSVADQDDVASIDPGPVWGLHFLGGTRGRTLVNIARDARLLAPGAEHTGNWPPAGRLGEPLLSKPLGRPRRGRPCFSREESRGGV